MTIKDRPDLFFWTTTMMTVPHSTVPGTRRVPMAAAATTKRIRCCTCVSCVGTNEYSTVQQYSSTLYANPKIVRVQDRSLIIVTDKLEEGRALIPNIACKTKAIGGEVSVGSCNVHGVELADAGAHKLTRRSWTMLDDRYGGY